MGTLMEFQTETFKEEDKELLQKDSHNCLSLI